jgi:hypothetical protein
MTRLVLITARHPHNTDLRVPPGTWSRRRAPTFPKLARIGSRDTKIQPASPGNIICTRISISPSPRRATDRIWLSWQPAWRRVDSSPLAPSTLSEDEPLLHCQSQAAARDPPQCRPAMSPHPREYVRPMTQTTLLVSGYAKLCPITARLTSSKSCERSLSHLINISLLWSVNN